MSSDEKRNSTIEKLRIILDNGSKKLHPKDEKYLQALHRRLKRTSAPQFTYAKRAFSQEPAQVDESLKPRVIIHQKEQPKVVELPEVCSEIEEKQPEGGKQEHAPENDGLFEVEKVEVEGPEFVEVIPKELPKKKEETVEQKEKQTEELPTETKDIRDDAVKEKPTEKEIPEWEPLPAYQEKEETIEGDKKTADDEFFEEEIPTEEEIVEKKQVETVEEDIFKEEEAKEDNLSERETELEKEAEKETFIDEEESTEDEFLEEGEATTFTEEGERKEDIFADVNSIDEKISQLLQENGITSIEMLRDTQIKQLTKIKGIKRKIAKKIKKEVEALPLQQLSEDDDNWQIVDIDDNTFDEVEEFGETSTKQQMKDSPLLEEKEDWETFTEEPLNKKEQGYQYGNYTLYEKEIETKTGKKRSVRFFSKGEPEKGIPIDLPQDYSVKVNKRTGVPYLKKSKKNK